MTDAMLLFILGSSGITLIVTSSTLLNPVRDFFNKPGKIYAFIYKVMNCAMCFGFHVGIIMWFLQGTMVYDILCAAGMISLVSWVTIMKM
jgi:hypothetical protein